MKANAMKEKLSGGTFKHVEGELYHYPMTKRELRDLSNFILERSTKERNGKQIKDPTGERAAAILMDKRIAHLEQVIDAIETVYESISPEKQKLMHLLYWDRPKELTWDGIAKHLHISKRQAQRWRKTIVERIAEKMGWR